jgi:ketosteroid isomerase-like protein
VPHDLTPGDGQDVLARFKAARERRDPDALMALFSEDADVRLDPFEPSLVGSLALRGHWNAVMIEQRDVELDAERVWVSGRPVLASWHAAWTEGSSGARRRERAFATLELDEEGLVVRMRAWPLVRVVSPGIQEPRDRSTPAAEGEGADGR